MKKSKLLTLCLTGFIAFSVAMGCSGEKETIVMEETTKKNQLEFVNYRDILDLNPHFYMGAMWAQEILFESLITLTPTGYAGALAETWDISDDGLLYTFHIREGVTFSDGEACDAYAIKANFDAILENRDRHVWLAMMQVLVAVDAPDANTFTMELSQPYYPMLTELAVTRPFAMISPKEMKEGSTKDGVNEYIGTGPYILTETVKDEYTVFTANENYWGGKPEIETIYVKVIPDNQTRVLALEKGEIDLIYGNLLIDADTMKKYQDSDKFDVQISEPTATRHIVISTTHEILKDPNVRFALSHATNKEEISEGIFYGFEPPADTLYSPTMPYCDVDLEPFNYDVAKAVSLLEESGWVLGSGDIREKDGQALSINFMYDADDVSSKNIAEYLKAEYLKIGVEMNIRGEERQSYFDSLKAGNFDLAFNISWGSPYDPQSSLSAMTGPVYGDYEAQQGLPNKAEIDKAIKDVLVSTDEVERQEMYSFILTSLHENAVYLPLTYECNKAIYTKDLEGVEFVQSQWEIPLSNMSFK